MSASLILLVEDNPDDIALMRRALRKNNMTNPVDVVRDGEEALRYLVSDDAAPLPALILLDINLPKVTGLEVLRTIRAHERTRYVPVVMLTTSAEECDILEGYGLGANSYVRKPVVFGDFVEAVRVLGLYWLLINQSALT